jgi:hypothetical protein
MIITNAKYLTQTGIDGNVTIVATIDGEQISVPIQVGNRHYDEIMQQVADGDLTIADAD